MTATPSAVAVELAAASCIALSGVPGLFAPGAIGQRIATASNAIGSAVGFVGLVLHGYAGDGRMLVLATLPIGRVAIALDGLSVVFLVPILLVSALGSFYGSRYWREGERNGRGLRFWWGIMTASMMGVVVARDSVVFLLAWEAMALAAFFLICTEDESADVRSAAWVYLVATHAGTLCLLGFFTMLAHTEGTTALWSGLHDGGTWISAGLLGLGIAGFGMKAGLMPLHLWLPGAHANAPSHVSALLSGVLLKMGIYGIVRVAGLASDPPLWFGAVLLGAGAASGVIGIALAVAQQDLKRLLAYSSIENVGIVVIGIGLASIGRSTGREDLVVLGLAGALLHVLNHSLMKPLLFMAAGNVLHATGTRQISSLGGLARAMPRTFALFVLGAVAICGLPPLNGFVGELLLYLGLLRAASDGPTQGWVWASLAAPALAMIGALAVSGFVKAAGVAFGGAPRSAGAARAHDPSPSMLAPMLVLAMACSVLGLLPNIAAPLLSAAVATWDPALADAAAPLTQLAPWRPVTVLGVASLASAVLLAIPLRRGLSAPASVVTWDCGYAGATSRMQYGASSFSETLVGLFDWVIRSRRSQPDVSGPFPRPSRFSSDVPEPALDLVVLPLAAAADRPFARLRALQRGPVQMYLLYVFGAVVILLVVAG